MHRFIAVIAVLLLISCKRESEASKEEVNQIDDLAAAYVRLGLFIGQYDDAFVDAYYGPDSLRPQYKPAVFPKDSLLHATDSLLQRLLAIEETETNDTTTNRAGWIADQVVAFKRRIEIYSGEYSTFDKESKDLFGAIAPVYDENHYASLVDQLGDILPGKGNVQERFQQLANKFIIPKEKLDTVFKAAIAESRKRTQEYFQLPSTESFSLEYVNNKPWNGYNWYKGNFTSLIQINTDINIFIDRAIDVASHESYPGHHVYNLLLEKNLYRDQGLVEISLYPLFSPQSLIAEGTANYGIEMAFPGDDKIEFAKEVLLPLAGLDTTGITAYFRAMGIKTMLNYARNEAARGLLNGTMTEAEALEWLESYALYNRETALKSIKFIESLRSYVINYNYGMDLVKEYIDRRIQADSSAENKWKVFGDLMSRQVRIDDMLE